MVQNFILSRFKPALRCVASAYEYTRCQGQHINTIFARLVYPEAHTFAQQHKQSNWEIYIYRLLNQIHLYGLLIILLENYNFKLFILLSVMPDGQSESILISWSLKILFVLFILNYIKVVNSDKCFLLYAYNTRRAFNIISQR